MNSGGERPGSSPGRARHAAGLLDACIRAANAGGTYIRQRTADVDQLDWRTKARADYVSDVDTGAEQRITETLLQLIPDARVLGEELSPESTASDGINFIVDPLDGTTNFLHRYPWYAVSVAAVAGGEVLAGAVLHVPNDILFTASLGGGAHQNGRPIRVSRTADPERSLIGTGYPFKHVEMLEAYVPQFVRIARIASGIRRAGAAALDLTDVAGGAFDGFWELMLAPWDMAAGMFIVREAGGRVTDLTGRDIQPSHSPVVASNGVMHEWLLEQLAVGG